MKARRRHDELRLPAHRDGTRRFARAARIRNLRDSEVLVFVFGPSFFWPCWPCVPVSCAKTDVADCVNVAVPITPIAIISASAKIAVRII